MRSFLVTREFWTGAAERAVRAFAVAMLAALGVPQAGPSLGVDVRHVGWRDAASLAAGAALGSLLLSLVAARAAGPAGSPSLVEDRPIRSVLASVTTSSPVVGGSPARTRWRVAFLGVTALAIVLELVASFDGNPETDPWTDMIVAYIPGEVTALAIGGLACWLVAHFGLRYWRRRRT